MTIRSYLDTTNGNRSTHKNTKAAGSVRSAVQDSKDSAVFFEMISTGEFPLDALDPIRRSYVRWVAETSQAPVDVPATMAIAVAGCALQGLCYLDLGAYKTHPNVYTMQSLGSGEGKSVTHNLMFDVFLRCERELYDKHKRRIHDAEEVIEIYTSRLARLRKQASKKSVTQETLAEISSIKSEIDSAKKRAVAPVFFCSNATSEALERDLAKQKAYAVLSSEGASILDIVLGKYSKNNAIDSTVYLLGYDGAPVRTSRISRECVSAEKVYLNTCLSVQPSVLAKLVSRDDMTAQGFLSRFLMCSPDSKLQERDVTRECCEAPPNVKEAYEGAILNLASAAYNTRCDSNDTTILSFSPEAQKIFYAFKNECNIKMAEGRELSNLKEFGARLPATMCKLAVHDHMFSMLAEGKQPSASEPESLVIGSMSVMRAYTILSYFIDQHRRIYGLLAEDKEVSNARCVLEFCAKKGVDEFTARDVIHNNRKRFPRKQVVDEACAVLLERGHIEIIPDVSVYSRSGGRPPAMRFALTPQGKMDPVFE